MKTLSYIFTALLIISTNFLSAQEGHKDPADYKRVSKNYEINELTEQSGDFDIVIDYNDEGKTKVSGKLTDIDYLNFDNKTFLTADGILKHYAGLVEKNGGILLGSGESIACSSEAGYHSGLGKGAVYKIKNGDKEAWLVIVSKIEGNYKLIMIQ